MNKITLFSRATDNKRKYDLDITDFLEAVQNGKYEDQITKIRITADKAEREKLKKNLNAVTLSATFATRNMNSVESCSGFIGIDIDDTNIDRVREEIYTDPYLYAGFVSAGGRGVCLIFKIDVDFVKKFETVNDFYNRAYTCISEYLFEKYGNVAITDESAKDVTRIRFVSYDPNLRINPDARVFNFTLPKKEKYIKPVVFTANEFDRIVNEMVDKGVDICEEYQDWVRTGFALVSKFGEAGRGYFHQLASMSAKYKISDNDKKYDNLVNTYKSAPNNPSIAFIYSRAKAANIRLYSEKTDNIIRVANNAKKDRSRGKETVLPLLLELGEVTQDEAAEAQGIIDQVFEKAIEPENENVMLDIIDFLQPYDLRRNIITRNVEMKGQAIDDNVINTLFIDCKINTPKASKDLVQSVIFSNKIKQYNPFKTFFESHQEVTSRENLDLLLSSIVTPTPNASLWVEKWLVSMIASIHGRHSPLMLVLCGGQNTGKTHWFRYLLPESLQYFYAESKLDEGKDGEILMTKKLIILDDEFGGKSKREDKRLKELTSKQWINVREPYGRVSVDLRRLAVLAGTTNDEHILTDLTGNRRILPIQVINMIHSLYNSVDRDVLFMELYYLYKSGYNYQLTQDEIILLEQSTKNFNQVTLEEELILMHFAPAKGTEHNIEWLITTAILEVVTSESNHRVNTVILGKALKKLGFISKSKKVNGNSVYAYPVIRKTLTVENDDELPF